MAGTKLSALKKKIKSKGAGASVSKDKPAKSPKARVIDLSGHDDGTVPWDTSDGLTKEAKQLGVRTYGGDDDVEKEELDEERLTKYDRDLSKVAKSVANKKRAYNSPATQELVTRAMLASVLTLLPGAHKAYMATKAEKSAYAYKALLDQARELMNDLRAMSSTDALADRVIAEAVQPAFMQLVSYIITEVSSMKTKIQGSGNVDSMRRQMNQQLNKLLEEIGQYGQETLFKANETARKNLKS